MEMTKVESRLESMMDKVLENKNWKQYVKSKVNNVKWTVTLLLLEAVTYCNVSPHLGLVGHVLPVYWVGLEKNYHEVKTFGYRFICFYWREWFHIWYMASLWWPVTWLRIFISDLLHIYFLFSDLTENYEVKTLFW